MRKLVLFLILLSVLFACKNKNCIDAPDVSSMNISINVDRLDKKLYKIPTKEELKELITKNKIFAEQFLEVSQYPDTAILVNRFYALLHDPYIDSLFMEVDRVFGDFSDIKSQFEDAFRHIKYYYPDFKVPRIQTVVTGMNQDLFLSDTLLIIGLDYYLGEGAKYRPINIPDYILKRYQKEYLVPQCMILYSNAFNSTNYSDQTALAEMIFYGKSFFFAKNMMPCVPDSLLTGYTTEEMKEIYDHEDVIWASMLENKLLFETSHFVKDKFMGERPKTLEIGERCPGRIGRWVGWRILDSYVKHNSDVSFVEVMKSDDSNIIFENSKYKPVNY